jgi:hypothetical protein
VSVQADAPALSKSRERNRALRPALDERFVLPSGDWIGNREHLIRCLYALEVAAGLQPAPYTDERALHYARRAAMETPQ